MRWLARLIAYRKAGRNRDAIPWYEEALRREPGFAPALRRLGLVLDPRRAIAILARAPEDAMSQNNLGEILLRQNRLDDAIAALRRAIALDPDLPEAHNNLGVALSRAHHFAGAQQSFEQALRIDPGLAAAHRNLGLLLQSLGQHQRARYHLRRSAELSAARRHAP